MISGWERMGGIFDDAQIMSMGNRDDLIHIARMPGKMDGNDGFCSISDNLFQPAGIEIQCVIDAINEYRLGLKVGHDLCGCRKSHGRNKDLISFANPRSLKS